MPDGSLHGIRGDRSAGEEDPVGHVDHAIAGVNIGLDHIGRATGFVRNHDGLTVERRTQRVAGEGLEFVSAASVGDRLRERGCLASACQVSHNQ